MVIKLKSKRTSWATVGLALVGIIVICCLCFYLIDQAFNGVFVDWFNHNFIIEYKGFDQESGMEILYSKIIWSKLKTFLLGIFIFTALLLCIIYMFIYQKIFNKVQKKVIDEISNSMDRFLNANTLISGFPIEYSEIENHLLKINEKMESQKRQIEDETRRKSELITYLAHDLKTPLASVIGYLCLLSETPDLPAEQRKKYLKIAIEKAYRLERLIYEFFDITRYNLNDMVLNKQKFDLNFMLIQLSEEFYPIIQEKQMEIKIKVPENLSIHADPDKLARVFNNILKNAVAYGQINSQICINVYTTEKLVYIVFSNFGHTIPKEKLELIFEQFFRLDESRASDTGGAGLGLAIAKKIIELHNGTITATSENNLTKFEVILPYNII